MATTVQAQRVIDALKEIGLKHGSWRNGGDFTVRTDITRRRAESGFRYSEFGDAMAHIQNRAAQRVAHENAQKLADQGLGVIVVIGTNDFVDVVVSSRHNPTHSVSVLQDGEWSTLPKEVVS